MLPISLLAVTTSLSMIVYTRNELLSKCYWWKDSELGSNSPISPQVWATLLELDILRPRRGKRGGRRTQIINLSSTTNVITNSTMETANHDSFTINTQDGELVSNHSCMSNENYNTDLHIPVRISERRTIDKEHSTTIVAYESRHRNTTNLVKVQPFKPGPSSSVPSLFLSNVCHISNKVDELRSVMLLNKASIAIITESWLNPDIPDSTISLGNNYVSYRLDRPTPGGGVLAYISSYLPTTRLTDLEEHGKEVIWLLLKPTRTPRPFSAILVVGVYYPPGQSKELEREMVDYLTRGVDSVLMERPSTGIVIGGDFNSLNLRPICLRLGLKKLVKAPTRGENTLDNLLTNMSELYHDTQHLPPIGRSDHQCLLVTPKTREKIPATTKLIRVKKPANVNALGLKLNQEDWDSVLSSSDVDDKVLAFNSIISKALDDTMPLKSVRFHPSDKPWMTSQIKILIRNRQKAYIKGNKDKYNQIKEKVSRLITFAKQKFYQDKAQDLRHSNPGKWYRTIYAMTGADKQPADITVPSKTEQTKLANDLLDAFTKPWEDREPSALLVSSLADNLIDRPPTVPNIGQVKAALKRLNPKKATGCDGVPAWLLKDFHEELSPVIHNIISASILQCKYPTPYKRALVTPVPKVSSPVDISNDFRQISVLPIIAKLLERFQLDLNKHELKIIADNQHAFRQDRSTVTALACSTQDWFNATDLGCKTEGVHIVFVDFKKAFDLVDHGILLNKLAASGVNRGFWKWTQSFLAERTLLVKLPDAVSNIGKVIAGVPQGGVISPTLFNVYINDVEENIPGSLGIKTTKFADDLTLYQTIPEHSTSRLQEGLNQVNLWADRNKMTLNAKKTKDMWSTFKKHVYNPPPLCVNNAEISRESEFKLLGVVVQENLKWNSHISSVIKKANKRIYHIRACRKAHLPHEIGLTTYTTKIRPLLEYACPIWGGIPDYLSSELQKVQDRCLKTLGLPKDTLESLACRRDKLTKNELERMLKNDDFSHLFKQTEHNYHLRSRKSTNCQIPTSRTKRHLQSFIPRAMRL